MAKMTREDLAKIHEKSVRSQYPLIRQVKPGKLTLCAECPRIHVDGTWKKIDTLKAIERSLDHSLKPNPGSLISTVEFTEPDFLRKPGIKRTETVLAIVKGRNEEISHDYQEEYEVPLDYEVTICELCKKKSPTYHQGALQIRNETELSKLRLKGFLHQASTKGVHLSNRIDRKNGTDYYISDHRAIGNIAKKLHKEFGGELKLNAQHFSEDKQAGKILYRTNALVVLPEYTKGCIIKKDEQYFLILGIGNKVKAENLMTGKLESFSFVRGDAEVLKQLSTQVTNTEPFEVLDPETYQPVEPVLSRYSPVDFENGEEVLVAKDKSYVFLVPPV